MFCVVVYLSSNIVAMPFLYFPYFIITNLFGIPIELSNRIKMALV
jgi:hypothetical protein